MQTETSSGESETTVESELSSESEVIPSFLYISGVTETYRNWDGESTGLAGSASSFFKTLASVLGGILGVLLIVGVIVLIVAGVLYVIKQRKAKKPTGSAYVLMEDEHVQ